MSNQSAEQAVRQEYRTLTEEEKAQISTVKELGKAFLLICDHIGSNRELAIAKTKMEEAVMWAVKAITG